jgi:hypothetical protein
MRIKSCRLRPLAARSSSLSAALGRGTGIARITAVRAVSSKQVQPRRRSDSGEESFVPDATGMTISVDHSKVRLK